VQDSTSGTGSNLSLSVIGEEVEIETPSLFNHAYWFSGILTLTPDEEFFAN